MNIKENSSPIYLQIAEKIATQIFGGKLAPGAKLPSVRDIALKERANPNTVQKALSELEEDGLILSKRTSGNFVTEDKELIMKMRDTYAENLTKTYEAKMQDVGAEVTIPKILWVPEEKKERKKWFF